MHTGYNSLNNGVLKGVISFLKELLEEQNLYLVDYNPNLCVGKSSDKLKKYYSFHDLLFVRKW